MKKVTWILWIFPPIAYRFQAIGALKEDHDWKEFRDAQVNETLVTGVSAAIFAQVALTALSLEGTPPPARALHVMALVFGLISTITTCWNQNILGSFNQKDNVKDWMTGPDGNEASALAATQLAFPGLLLFLAAVFLVAGLGVHISEVWRGGALWAFGVGLVFGAGGYGSVALGKWAK